MSCQHRFANLPPFEGAPPEQRVFQIPTAAIQFLTAWMEAADGIGLVRTLDEWRGLIECWVMPDYKAEFEQLIAALAAEWPIQEIASEFE